ncbi:hypothetical protein H106_02234 [Trichophyton rubrum CBS 735.88]|nr:hypothetical protein H106_02234 [Trichophyton rubrum CBS 735.88]
MSIKAEIRALHLTTSFSSLSPVRTPEITTDKMKFTAATIIAMVYVSTAFASNVSCVYQKGTKGDHIVGLKGAVQAYGGQYHVSGRSGSTFATYGSAKLTLRRTGDHPSVNSYTDAATVANKIQEIIDCCYNYGYTECVGNGDIISFSDGGRINVNVAHN